MPANTERKYGVAIVGTGWVSTGHVTAWQRVPEAQIVAVQSRQIERGRAFIQEQNLHGASAYVDYDLLLGDPRVDVVSICTPHNYHADQAIKAAQAGKHIVIEKPVAMTTDDLRAMRDAVRKAKVKTVVSFVLRWNPLFEIIKSLLADDSIGRVFQAEVDYYHGIGPWYAQFGWNVKKAMGGSSLLTAGIHAVDGLRWFVGQEATEVVAFSTRSNHPPYDQYEYDPTLAMLCRFADGTIGKVASNVECHMPYVFNVELFGTKGTIRNNQLWSHKLKGQTTWATIPTIMPDSGDVAHHPFAGEIRHLMDCILQDRESHSNLEDAVKSHELCLAADMSAAEGGKPIKLPLLG